MLSPLRPRRGKWIALASVGGLVLAILIAGVSIHVTATRRWEETRKRYDARLQEAQSRDATRPVLRGTAVPGNAWDEYSAAVAEMNRAWPDLNELSTVMFPGGNFGEVDIDVMEKVVIRGNWTIQLLRNGTRRARGRQPMDWEKAPPGWTGIGMSSDSLLCRLVVWRARVFQSRGRHLDAAEALLDLCQFGRDGLFNTYSRNAERGIAAYRIALAELGDLVSSGNLTPGELTQVAGELEILDRSFPPYAHTILNEGLWLPQRWIEIVEGRNSYRITPVKAWKYGFSVRLMAVESISAAERLMGPAAETDTMTWSEAQATFKRIEREMTDWESLVLANPGTYTLSGAARSRAIQAKIRLLRVACVYRATGDVPDLPDPFGGKLLTARSGGRLGVWSVGPDGVDNGGAGKWKDEEPLDLVLECAR